MLNPTIGAVTPPVGTLTFISFGVLGVKISDYTRSALPFLDGLDFVPILPVLVIRLANLLMGVGGRSMSHDTKTVSVFTSCEYKDVQAVFPRSR